MNISASGQNRQTSVRHGALVGFTIVELLIVVVVIAILAAITIVAYTGIQNRAKTSAVQSATTQLGKKLLAYAPQNNDTYPTVVNFRSSMGISSTDPSYSYDTADDQKAFCVSAIDANSSPFIAYSFTEKGQLLPGLCIRNYVINSGAEGSTMISSSAGIATSELSSDTASGWPNSGSRSFKITASSTGDARVRGQTNTLPVVASTPVQISVYVRNAAPAARQFTIGFQGRTSGGSVNATSFSQPTTIPAGSSAQLTASIDAATVSSTFSGSSFIEPMISRTTGAVGDVYYVDDFFIGYKSSSFNYSYTGSLPGWSSSAAVNDSQSFGPIPLSN